VREVKVGAAIIYCPDFYILHERKVGKNNGEIGKYGLYGGQFDKKKKDKTFYDTVSRELAEESDMYYPPSAFHYEEHLPVCSEQGGEKILTLAEIFLLNLPFEKAETLNKQYRDSKIMTPEEVSRAKALGHLTTVATAAFGKVKGI
jgi:hypothetical protein